MNVTPPCGICCCKGASVLDRVYPVCWGEKRVGDICLRKNGLYYKLGCQCSLPGNRIFRLFAEYGDWQCKIGIPAPEGGYYTLRANVRFGETPVDNLRFFVVADEDQLRQQPIPIYENEPFLHMGDLDKMVLRKIDGQTYLMLIADQNYSLLDT